MLFTVFCCLNVAVAGAAELAREERCSVAQRFLVDRLCSFLDCLLRAFCCFASQSVVAFVRLDLHVRDEGEQEFDQLIHASFSPLLQLEKTLEAH
jgi:hypothetical protein